MKSQHDIGYEKGAITGFGIGLCLAILILAISIFISLERDMMKISSKTITFTEQTCENFGGADYIRVTALDEITMYCKDGKEFVFDPIE